MPGPRQSHPEAPVPAGRRHVPRRAPASRTAKRHCRCARMTRPGPRCRAEERGFQFINPGRLADGDLRLILEAKHPADPVKKYVPWYAFEMREIGDSRKIGTIRLRIGRTRPLTGWCGHIGYGVAEKSRGHRYAARSCRLIFPIAYAHGLRFIWITCAPKNMPSRRTCERAGGQYVDTVHVPKGTELYSSGVRRVRRYRFDLRRIVAGKA